MKTTIIPAQPGLMAICAFEDRDKSQVQTYSGAMTRRPKLKLYPDSRGTWRWSLIAVNGRTLCDSGEGYSTKHKAQAAVLAALRCLRTAVGEIGHAVEANRLAPVTERYRGLQAVDKSRKKVA